MSERDARVTESATGAPGLATALLGECAGTFVMVFFGVGAVFAAVLGGAQVGLWQVAVVWAVGVSLGIYVCAALSGAHINPAITLAMAAWSGFPPARVLPYWAAQLLGAAVAAALLYALYARAIVAFEAEHGLVRGGPGSELSAMVFGEYFPNPAIMGTGEAAWALVTPVTAFLAEMAGTAMLAFVVFAVISSRNAARPPTALAAVVIGVCVAAIISVLAPLTQAGLNPARDLGPRLVAFFLGWGEVAIPGPRGGWLGVYVLAPMAGALVGGGLYRLLESRLPSAAP